MNVSRQMHRDHRFGSVAGLSLEQMDLLIDQFGIAPAAAAGDLGGRNRPLFMGLTGLGKVVVKHYFRGGFIRHINRREYLRLGKSRGETEFEILARLREIGVSGPEPVAFASKGRIFYHAWLVTRAIPDVQSLIEICRSCPERAEAAMPAVTGQVRRLIRNGILHVDLHPGNILLDGKNQVFLIDFDKAIMGRINDERLGKLYVQRWRRAVKKYGLPDFLDRRMTEGLGR